MTLKGRLQGTLKVGDKAPALTLMSDTGEKVSLKDFKGQTIVLYFYPKDMTSGCTQQACDFRDAAPTFKRKKIVTIGISKDSVESHKKFKAKHDLNFMLLSDPDGKVCEAYDVWQEKSMYGKKYMGIVRSTFIIGPTLKIEKIYSKVKVKDHVTEVLKDATSVA